MTKTIMLITVTMLLLTAAIFAQDSVSERKMREGIAKQQEEKVALEKAANLSPASKVLDEKLKNSSLIEEDRKTILAAGKAGDKSVIPYLKLLATEDSYFGGYAQVALVQLGENEYYNEIVAELNNDHYSAILKLALIENKAAYQKLYQLLDDTTPRPISSSDAISSTKSEIVMTSLGRTVKNPPRLPNGIVNDSDVAAWKAWFAKNKHLIE